MKQKIYAIIGLIIIITIGVCCYFCNPFKWGLNNHQEKISKKDVGIQIGLQEFDNSGVHPILDRVHRIIGGTIDGKWVGRSEIVKKITGREKYKLYTQNACLGEFLTYKTSQEAISMERAGTG